MITREGNRIIIELPDESKAEAIEWLLLKVLSLSLATTSTATPSTPQPSSRPSEQRLAHMESEREANRLLRQKREADQKKFKGPVYPWKELKGNPHE
jgi:hypothetical protein